MAIISTDYKRCHRMLSWAIKDSYLIDTYPHTFSCMIYIYFVKYPCLVSVDCVGREEDPIDPIIYELR